METFLQSELGSLLTNFDRKNLHTHGISVHGFDQKFMEFLLSFAAAGFEA